MLLRTSISKTKKFFQKTLQTFKSFLSPDYQRLPKSPPRTSPFSSFPGVIDSISLSQNYKELDKFYADFTDKWDNDRSKMKTNKKKKRSDKKIAMSSRIDDEKVESGSLMKFRKWREDQEEEKKKKKKKERIVVEEGKIKEEGRICWVQQKLKELEMVERGNVEHLLDIEEVLHYYSRLTCLAYVEIVDKFFMEIYTEISWGSA
ncbi:hypothetical protein U1Q18_028585 [Sarracenia purpurea var. burkii]